MSASTALIPATVLLTIAFITGAHFPGPLGLILAPVTVGLIFGVVYGQFHYGVDALAGIVVAAAVWLSLNGGMWPDRAPALHHTTDLESSPLRL